MRLVFFGERRRARLFLPRMQSGDIPSKTREPRKRRAPLPPFPLAPTVSMEQTAKTDPGRTAEHNREPTTQKTDWTRLGWNPASGAVWQCLASPSPHTKVQIGGFPMVTRLIAENRAPNPTTSSCPPCNMVARHHALGIPVHPFSMDGQGSKLLCEKIPQGTTQGGHVSVAKPGLFLDPFLPKVNS